MCHSGALTLDWVSCDAPRMEREERRSLCARMLCFRPLKCMFRRFIFHRLKTSNVSHKYAFKRFTLCGLDAFTHPDWPPSDLVSHRAGMCQCGVIVEQQCGRMTEQPSTPVT